MAAAGLQEGDTRVDTTGVTTGTPYNSHRDIKANAVLHPTQGPHRPLAPGLGASLGVGWGHLSLSQVLGGGCDQGARSSATFPMEKTQRLKSEHPTDTFTPETGFFEPAI